MKKSLRPPSTAELAELLELLAALKAAVRQLSRTRMIQLLFSKNLGIKNGVDF
jgi:hypothetical protein